MNKAILNAITKLNAHAGKGYKWPAFIDGSIGDVFYKDRKILKGNADNYTYCCGITLQAYLIACEAIGKDLGSVEHVLHMRAKWFITSGKTPIEDNAGPLDALSPQHGMPVTLEKAEPGDLVQIWRRLGSGHSCIFINQFTDNGFRGIKYWSSQSQTNGIGYKTEYFEGVKNPITKIHICRPI